MTSSQLKSSIQDIQGTIRQLKMIKYPVKPIANAFFINKKINTFNQKVKEKIKQTINPELNAYRQVRGDGNCFFRAFAFSYIANKKSLYFQDIFGSLDQINFQACKESSIPKEFKSFYKNKLLKSIFIASWQKQFPFFFKKCKHNYKRALSLMLNKNHYLDFIIILYFRSLCLFAFDKNKQQFKQFLKGTQIQEITQYGSQSQGLILKLCSKILQMNIFIYEIRKNDVVYYEYRNLRGNSIQNSSIYLLFYDSHYDLFEHNSYLTQQMQDQKEDEQYFQDVNINFIQGACIQCSSYGQIGQQTGLCLRCYNKSLENMSKYVKDRQISGTCVQCNRKSNHISEQLMICQNCLNKLQFQSKISSSSHGNSSIYSKKSPCLTCKKLKFHYELNSNQICEDCKALRDAQSFLRPSNNRVSQSVLSTSDVPSLENKLVSRINQQPMKKEEHFSSQVKKAKIFIKNPIIFLCKKCSKEVDNNDQNYCKNCLKDSKLNPTNLSIIGSNLSNTSSIKTNVCRMCKQTDNYYKIQNGFCKKCQKIKYESTQKSNIYL